MTKLIYTLVLAGCASWASSSSCLAPSGTNPDISTQCRKRHTRPSQLHIHVAIVQTRLHVVLVNDIITTVMIVLLKVELYSIGIKFVAMAFQSGMHNINDQSSLNCTSTVAVLVERPGRGYHNCPGLNMSLDGASSSSVLELTTDLNSVVEQLEYIGKLIFTRLDQTNQLVITIFCAGEELSKTGKVDTASFHIDEIIKALKELVGYHDQVVYLSILLNIPAPFVTCQISGICIPSG